MECNKGVDYRGVDHRLPRTWGWINEKLTPQVKIAVTEEKLKRLFRRFDTDGDGRLSKQELEDAFHSIGSSFPGWRAWRALCHADANGDGYISEHEFDGLVKYCVKRGYAKK
ncbi:hypothetical protein JRO89_XS07G0067100 [Xanthoceras sorbifolium]|uniref:EF-hand domain-containing protein n=1 Tax=Xanthoceras sorbifolium TaxID=99658 RepID=A0ABQ8HSZ4_9ROSI|nr:hypothetical protein JRO89_XS07G0067100 [Xanthoceras sorbifolium]